MKQKLKIGAHNFNVDLFSTDIDSAAEIDSHRMTIKLSTKRGKTIRRVSMLHEIIHGINSEINEPMTDAIAQQLTQVFLDNKWFAKWFLK